MRMCFSVKPSNMGMNTAQAAKKRSANGHPSALNGERKVNSCQKVKSALAANALSARAAKFSISTDMARK